MNFQFARHTSDLKPLIEFYTKILGLEILGEFKNHSNYDGVFIGKKSLSWHLEFTTNNTIIEHSFNEDDLIVFYPSTKEEYKLICDKVNLNNLPILIAKNPYWNENGIFIKDPDGQGIIIAKVTS